MLTVAREMRPTFGSVLRSPESHAQEPEQLGGREAAIVRVGENGGQRWFERTRIADRIQIDDLPAAFRCSSKRRRRPTHASAMAITATNDVAISSGSGSPYRAIGCWRYASRSAAVV